MSETTDQHDIRETVRARYAAAATLASFGDHDQARALEAASCGGVPIPGTTGQDGRAVFGADLYGLAAADGANESALAASLGCGVPTPSPTCTPTRRCSTWGPVPARTS